MSSTWGDPRGKALLALVGLMAVPGYVAARADSDGFGPVWAMPAVLLASGIVFLAGYLHDRDHRRRGEQPHAAIWGRRRRQSGSPDRDA